MKATHTHTDASVHMYICTYVDELQCKQSVKCPSALTNSAVFPLVVVAAVKTLELRRILRFWRQLIVYCYCCCTYHARTVNSTLAKLRIVCLHEWANEWMNECMKIERLKSMHSLCVESEINARLYICIQTYIPCKYVSIWMLYSA